MEKKISEAKNILQTTTKSSMDLETLNSVIDQLKYEPKPHLNMKKKTNITVIYCLFIE